MKSLPSRRSPIGLDIGAHCVKAVQSIRCGSGWRIAASARFPRPNQAAALSSAELADVKAVLHRQGFTGHDVIVATSGEKVLSGAMELPARRADVPMDQIARAEFARIHKCDLAAAEFCWWELPAPARGGKGTHVMAVAFLHSDAEAQLNVYDRVGLRVKALDTPASALGRSCMGDAGARGMQAALDFGWRGVALVLLRDGVIVYERRIVTVGLSKLHAALAARLRVDAAIVEQLIQEIGTAGPADSETSEIASEARPVIAAHLDSIIEEVLKGFGYAQHQYPDAPAKRLIVSGGGACIPGVIEHFGATLGVEVRASLSSDAAADGKSGQRATASHSLAAGLASFQS